MISPGQLQRWARLYDLGHQNLDGWSSEEAQTARDELNQELQAAFDAESVGSVSFGQFRRGVIQRLRALLRNPPPTV
jgi:hypothetical protein